MKAFKSYLLTASASTIALTLFALSCSPVQASKKVTEDENENKINQNILINTNILLSQNNDKINESANSSAISYLNMKKVLESNFEINNLLNSSKDKNIAVFVGNIRVGKSTLIYYLNDQELITDQLEKSVNLNNVIESLKGIKLSPDRFKVHHNQETTITEGEILPHFIKSKDLDLLFYDLSSFGDTKEIVTNLVNQGLIKNIIENSKSTKMIFVADQGDITADKGQNFKALLDKAEKLLPEESIDAFSSLIITQCTYDNEDLLSYLKEITDSHPIIETKSKKGKVTPLPILNTQEHQKSILNQINKTRSFSNIKIDPLMMFQSSIQKPIHGIIEQSIYEIVSDNLKNSPHTTAKKASEIRNSIEYLFKLPYKIEDDLKKSLLLSLIKAFSQDYYSQKVKIHQQLQLKEIPLIAEALRIKVIDAMSNLPYPEQTSLKKDLSDQRNLLKISSLNEEINYQLAQERLTKNISEIFKEKKEKLVEHYVPDGSNSYHAGWGNYHSYTTYKRIDCDGGMTKELKECILMNNMLKEIITQSTLDK